MSTFTVSLILGWTFYLNICLVVSTDYMRLHITHHLNAKLMQSLRALISRRKHAQTNFVFHTKIEVKALQIKNKTFYRTCNSLILNVLNFGFFFTWKCHDVSTQNCTIFNLSLSHAEWPFLFSKHLTRRFIVKSSH